MAAVNPKIADERRRESMGAEDNGDDVDQERTPEEKEEENFFAEIGEAPSDSVVHVYKMNVDGKDVKIWKGGPGTFDLDQLAKKFGSGDYRVLLYSKVETGQLVRRFGRVIPILLPPEDDARLKAIREGKVNDVNAGGFSLDMLTQAIRAAIPAAPPQNNIAMLKELAEIVRAISPQASAPAAPQISPVDLIKLMMQFRDSELPRDREAGGFDLLIKLVEKFSGPIGEALSKTAANTANAPAALPAPGGDAPAAQPGGNDPMLKLKMGIAFLISQAERNSDPETYAGVILDNVPENELRPLLAAPNWLDILGSVNPEVKKFPDWFAKLKAAVEMELNAPEK